MMMKATEIRKMSVSDLEAKLADLKKDLFFLRMQHATNQLDNPIKINAVKKDIARIKTIIREKELSGKPELVRSSPIRWTRPLWWQLRTACSILSIRKS